MKTFDEWLIDRLRMHGAYAGTYDGAHGRETIAAIKKFQIAEGLRATGMADQNTVDALRRMPGQDKPVIDRAYVPAEPVWMREARRYMGLREIAGARSNGTIMGWAKKLGGWIASFYTNDDIPWCGLAVGAWIATTLPNEPLPGNPLSALAWKNFGTNLKAPCLGAILVFSRNGGGHVGLYVGEDQTHYHVLGGNQSNSVSITRIAKSRWVATRWPKTGEPTASGRVLLTSAGVAVSKNEA